MRFCFRVSLHGTFDTDFCVEIWTSGALRTRFSFGRYCKKQLFAEVIFFMNLGSTLLISVSYLQVFYGFGNNFDDFWCLGDRLEI